MLTMVLFAGDHLLHVPGRPPGPPGMSPVHPGPGRANKEPGRAPL